MSREMMKLGDIYSIKKGKKVEETPNFPDSIRYIQIDDLRNDDNIKYCENNSKYVVASPRDIIIAWDGANAGTCGYGIAGAIGSTLAVLSTNRTDVDTNYVGAFLQTKFDYLREHCTGATIPHINRKSLEDIEIPLPHVSIQKKIADTLNKILTLIEKRKEQIAVLDEAVKSWYMYNLGPQASSYSDWKGISIKEIAADKKNSMRTGPFGSNLLHSEFVDSGIAVLGIDNAVNNKFEWKERRYITKEKYEKLRSYTVFPRDVIITIMGTTGRSAVIPVDIPLSINTKHLACITLDKEKANPYFISYSIHSHPYLLQQIKNRNKGAIMDGLNLTIIKNLQIPLPPLELQNKFEDIIIEAEQKKELLNKSLAELEITHKSTIQKAFNGELF